jgi:hypothetical protein
MLKITNPEGNANQNHNEIGSPQQEWQKLTNARKDWDEGELLYAVGGMSISRAIMENSMEIPQKLKMALPYDSTVSLLSIYPK